MRIKICLVALAMGMMGWLSAPTWIHAASLSELAAAMNSHYSSGAISDSDVYAMLNDLLNQAQAAGDTDAENALRGSFIDVCNAFRGAGISSSAADDMVSKAQP